MSLPEPDPVAATVGVYERDCARYVESYLRYAPEVAATDLVELCTAGLAPGARILDLGAGSGRDLAHLRAAGFDAVGVDAAVGMATHAAVHGPVVCADMRALPFATGSATAVLAAASLLHLPSPDAADAVTEIRRVLVPGGRLTVSVKHGVGETYDAAGRYFQLYTGESLDRLLAAGGFTVTSRRVDADSCRGGLRWLTRTATC